jgi:hypothetical protein
MQFSLKGLSTAIPGEGEKYPIGEKLFIAQKLIFVQ